MNAVSQLVFPKGMFINGKYQPAISGDTLPTINPSTGKVITTIAAGDERDINLAVANARETFNSGVWSAMAPSERRKILIKFADLIDANRMTLTLFDVLEAGKPFVDTFNGDIPDTAATIRWHAEAIDKVLDSYVTPTGNDSQGLIVREPIGVVGAVTPWNFPAQMVSWKIGPALATGNCVVLKPAENTSLSALFLAQLAVDAGVPPGVFNVVTGVGEKAGKALGLHGDVDMVAFTGSTEVGRYFLQYSAASNLKKISLEMGGKSAQIVFADVVDDPAFFEHVADNVVAAAFWNMSENCSCGSRLIVHESIKDKLLMKVEERLRSQWKVGDPLDPTTKIGPMIDEDHMKKVLGYVQSGLSEGAKLYRGSTQRTLAETGGYFVAPVILDEVKSVMKVAQEEIFGPVLCVLSFTTYEQALRIANDSLYGLAGSVYSLNINTAMKAARYLHVIIYVLLLNFFLVDFCCCWLLIKCWVDG